MVLDAIECFISPNSMPIFIRLASQRVLSGPELESVHAATFRRWQ